LVLCGGGSRGALEVGFYRALVGMDMPIDLIVGSSVGAPNGRVHCCQCQSASDV